MLTPILNTPSFIAGSMIVLETKSRTKNIEEEHSTHVSVRYCTSARFAESTAACRSVEPVLSRVLRSHPNTWNAMAMERQPSRQATKNGVYERNVGITRGNPE